MADIQQVALEQILLNLRPAGASTTIPLANMIKLVNTEPAMPLDTADRDYSGANTGTFTAYVSSSKQAAGSSMALNFTTLSYRDLTLLAEVYLQGGVVPVETPAASGRYLWTHTSQATTDDLARAGIQAGGNIGILQTIDNLGSTLTLTGEASTGKLTAAAALLGGGPTDEGSFAVPVPYDSGEQIVFGEDVALYVDDTAANIGTTQINCEAITGVTMTLNNGVSSVDTTCGKQFGRDKRFLELTVNALMTADVYSEMVHELDDEKRYIVLEVKNDPLLASATAYWRLYVSGFWKPYALSENGPFRAVALTTFSEFDETLGYDWLSELYNNLATFPAYQP